MLAGMHSLAGLGYWTGPLGFVTQLGYSTGLLNLEGCCAILVGIRNPNASRYIAGKLLQKSFHEFEDSQYEAIDLGRPSLNM